MAAGDENKDDKGTGQPRLTAPQSDKPLPEGSIPPVGTTLGDVGQQPGESWSDYLHRQNRHAVIPRNS